MGGRLKWYEAAEILGISDRQMRRWKSMRSSNGMSLEEGRENPGNPACGGNRVRSKPDRSLAIKTGHLDLLPTPASFVIDTIIWF